MTKAIVCFGEVLLRLSPPGRELLLQSARFDAHVGGAEANVAVSLSKLGHRSRMVSALPDSTLGHACADELRRHGVDTRAIAFGQGRMGMYFLTHGAGHRPAEVLYDRTDSVFALARGDLFGWRSVLGDAAWIHVSGIAPAVSTTAAEAALQAVTQARQSGVKVSFDCNFRPRLWGARTSEASRLLRGLCEQADLLFGNERDIELILGFEAGSASPAEKLRRAADAAFEAFARLQFMACTDRARESVEVQQLTGMLLSRQDTWSTRPYALHGIVDRIGAGDAFAAGALHGLIGGFDPQKTVDFATAAACLKHSIPGDFNLVSAADVEFLLSEQHTDVRR